MMRRTHRLAALLAAATAFAGSAAAAADPAPSDPQPKPGPSPSCAALAEPANDLRSLQDRLTGIAGNAAKGGLDIGNLISLYGQSQDLLRSLREESGKLRDATDQVSEPELHDSTLAVADTLDEGSDFVEQLTNPAAPKPNASDVSSKVADLSTHAANSLQRFGGSYQKTCGVDLGLKDLGPLAKLGGLSPNQTAPAAPNQQAAPAPTAPSEEPVATPAPASNKSLLAPAPIK
ncbi:hypothetical protein [Segniliparus rugosus]|uniref:Secreted protein n=1 Tax=Segniliparus rugosus (strain ATCC BAA-974 / DSM 45345 / CCUG 50838 / CIP 108380 / JCM 13579 / CDC 945) TaxID=679197 RepID=E5XV76_SEGRC|nr:hypothetical protein [Segniliparus rugosus]EFV11781.1 hypothetical protein HMPREF9336_03398 [Segniliparus rugosus ATCC BAA-974]